jgi:CRP-like cAMP-binding protein
LADYQTGSLLLDRLPRQDVERIRPLIDVVSLEEGDILYPGSAESDIRYVYFPLSCVTSMLALMTGGECVEAVTVGREGLAGYQVIFGTRRMLERWVCQVSGTAARVSVSDLWDLFPQSPALLATLLLYGQSLMTALSQSVACNGLHVVAERCAKWLLLTHDRAQTSEFRITHEYLSTMLGVRRSSVSIAASTLQAAGYIRYARGRMTILDRRGLEASSCECYAKITREWERLMNSDTIYEAPVPGAFKRMSSRE